MATGLKATSKPAPPPAPSVENGHGNGPFSRRHRVSQVREQRQLFQFEYEGERYEAVYNKGAITVEFGRSLNDPEGDADNNQLIGMLSALLLDWDLVEDDGETPLPFSLEELERLPTAFLIAMVNAIWQEYSPGPPAPNETP